MADFPRIKSTFGVTPYNPVRDDDEKRRAMYEHYQSQVGAQPLAPETLPWNVPFEPGVAAQRALDERLQQYVVDPLAQAGYEGLGAGLAAIPSAAHSMIVPQTEFDVAGTIIPLPGVAKAMKKGKFRKIRNAMKAEAPEEVAEIIAKQASKDVPPSTRIEGPKNDFYDIKDNEMYEIDGETLSGSDLRDYLLSLSTGDFHTAKWKSKPKGKGKPKVDEALEKQARIDLHPDIIDGIKKKYGLESENWSTLDDEPDVEFGISDLSGKKGNLISITDGEQTLQVLNDEYLDIMGLSGGIGLDETPFYQAMKKGKGKSKSASLSPDEKAINETIKIAENEGRLSYPRRSQLERAMRESKKAIEQGGDDAEFHEERFKKIKALLQNVTTLKGPKD